jgi:hypothetical protein
LSEYIVRPPGYTEAGLVALTSTCRRIVGPPSPTAACEIHGAATPWHTPPGCTLPAATLCHICLRGIVPVRHRFTWTLLYPTCTRIETTLAAPFGATTLTPHTGQSDTQAATLFGRRNPDHVHQTQVVELVVIDDRPSTATRDRLDGSDPLTRLKAHAATQLASMTSSRGRFGEWMLTFPASARASAEAYLQYAETQHPWIIDLIPPLHDVDWLTAIATETGR